MMLTRRQKREREREREREKRKSRNERGQICGGEKAGDGGEREIRNDLPVLRKRFKRIQDGTRPLPRREWCPGPNDQDG